MDGEHLDEHDTEEESRRRIEDEGQGRKGVVRWLVAPQDLEDPEGDGDDHGQEGREPEQEHRLRQLLQHDGRHRLVQLVGVAQVEREHVPDQDEELRPDRLVEPVLVEEQCDLRRRGPRSEDDPGLGGRPAGEQVIEDEGNGADANDDDDRLEYSPNEVADHALLLAPPGLRLRHYLPPPLDANRPGSPPTCNPLHELTVMCAAARPRHAPKPGRRAWTGTSAASVPGPYLAGLQKYQSSATQVKSGFWGVKPQTFLPTSSSRSWVLGCQMPGRSFAR